MSFDGSADIDLPGVNSSGNQNTSGNAGTATALATPITIGGVSFDGSADIDLPGVNSSGNQNTTGTAAGITGATVVDNSITISDTDGFIINDAGTMKSIPASTLKTYATSGINITGLDVKKSVRVATTANGTLNSAFANGQTVDGITLNTGDRILIKDQSTGSESENGIYTVNDSGAPTRASDFNDSSSTKPNVTPNAFTFVEEGTTNADNGFVLNTNAPITLGTTALTFSQFSGAGTITAGDGLDKSGNTLSVKVDDSTIQVNPNDKLEVKEITGDKIIGGTISSTTIDSLAGNLSLGDNNITNVGDINCDSISVDDAATGLNIDLSGGNTTKNKITLRDNLEDALNINENGNSYLKFVTTDGSESIVFGKNSTFNGTTIADLGTVTTVDINGGTIDGTTIATSNITVGSGKTLDVADGTLTLANNQISGDKVEGGTIASITISQLGGAMDCNSQAMTNVNINGGDIALTNIIVGLGNSLNVEGATLTLANNQISGDKVEGGTIDSITISQLGGAMDCNNQNMTNVNINSGAIDGTNITVGDGKTLDVSAGTLTLANNQIENSKLANSTISGISLGTNLSSLTVDNSTLQFNSDTTYNGSVQKTISVKEISLGTHTSGNYVSQLISPTGSLIDLQQTPGEGHMPSISVDLASATTASIQDGDYILFLDGGETGSAAKDSISNVATLFAGSGLTAFNSEISVDSLQPNITSVGILTQLTLGSTTITSFIDEDNMVSDSDTAVPTQKSVKAYVDSNAFSIHGLSGANIAHGDYICFSDTDDSNNNKKEEVADLAVLFAGDGLQALNSVMSLHLKSNGGAVIESNVLAIDLGASNITGTLGVADGGTGATTPTGARTALGLTLGIADTNVVKIDGSTAANERYARFTDSGLEGITAAQVLTHIGAQPAISNDLTIFDDTNNADVSLSLGTSATEALVITVLNGASNKTCESVKFTTKTASSNVDHGKFTFSVDESDILDIVDGGVNINGNVTFANLTYGGTPITTSGVELNILYGGTNATSTVVANTDRVVLNDNGTMVQVAVTDLDTYFSGTSQTLTNKTLTAPKFVDGGYIADANGNELVKFVTTTSAVNELQVTNAATGGYIDIGATGDDDDISISLTPKANGNIKIDNHIWPNTYGSVDQFLQTDGFGALSWANPSGVTLSLSSEYEICTVTGGNAIQGQSNLTYDGNTLSVGASSITDAGTDDKTLNIEQTLNDSTADGGGTQEFRLIKGTITETDTSGWDNIYLMDLMVGSTSQFNIDRYGNGYFSGTLTASSVTAASLSGNAATATVLATARNIGGVSFDGSANINPKQVKTDNGAAITASENIEIETGEGGSNNSTNDAANSGNITIKTGDGGTATSDNKTGGNAGDIILQPGVGGAKHGSGTGGTDGCVKIINTQNDTNGPILKMVKDKGAAGAANDINGLIQFIGDDDNQDQVTFSEIKSQVKVATNGQEGGKFTISVAEHDGTKTAGLVIEDGDADGELDVTLGAGTESVTTVSGKLKLGDITIDSFKDEADMNSNSATTVPTQQSVKAYVDSNAFSIHGLSEAVIADGDFICFSDASDSNNNKKEAVAHLATLFAGDGLQASSSVMSLYLKSNGGAVIESNVLAIDLGASNITGTLGVADGGTAATSFTTGGILLGNGTSAITDTGVLADTKILIGDGSGAPNSASLSGDVTMGNTGVVTIANSAVTLAKIQNVAANSILVRDANSAGVLTEKALTNTQILIGDGDGFTAASLSGDVTMGNTGVVTIANNAVTESKLNISGGSVMTDDLVDNDKILIYDTSATSNKNCQLSRVKTYIGSSVGKIKNTVKVATTTNGDLALDFKSNNSPVIDGVTLSENDRILIKNQTSATENGIYKINADSTPTRVDLVSSDSANSTMVFVEQGTINANQGFICNSLSSSDTVGSNSLSFLQFTTPERLKALVKVATTTSGTLSSSFAPSMTIDGVSLTQGDRILIKNQSSASENGIYTVSNSGAPSRASDLPSSSKADSFVVFVSHGTNNINQGFRCSNVSGSDVVGLDNLTFEQITSNQKDSVLARTDLVTYTVTVDSKTSEHIFNTSDYSSGSYSSYYIDGIEAPFLELKNGVTYKFDQSDSSNSGHPLRIYINEDKTNEYTTGVTNTESLFIYPGSSGAYTQIVISDSTPSILYFQCNSHSYMGGRICVSDSSSFQEIKLTDSDADKYVNIKAPSTLSSNYTLTLPDDDGTSGQYLQTNGSGTLSWQTVSGGGGGGSGGGGSGPSISTSTSGYGYSTAPEEYEVSIITHLGNVTETQIIVDITDFYFTYDEDDDYASTIGRYNILNNELNTDSYLYQVSSSNNKIIYKIVMTCLETPTGTNIGENIGLYFSTESSHSARSQGNTFDMGSNAGSLVFPNEFRKAGCSEFTSTNGIGYYYDNSLNQDVYTYNGLAGRYLYLVAKTFSGTNGTSQYTAGKFLITLYGV